MNELTRENITKLIEDLLDSESEFLVELTISPSYAIRVEIDSTCGVTIDRCVQISRSLEAQLDRDVCDFSLEVSSAGLGSPFRHPRQYQKFIGKPITALRKDGIRIDGTLLAANSETFTMQTEKIIPAWKDETGKKHKKERRIEEHQMAYNDMKEVSYRFE